MQQDIQKVKVWVGELKKLHEAYEFDRNAYDNDVVTRTLEIRAAHKEGKEIPQDRIDYYSAIDDEGDRLNKLQVSLINIKAYITVAEAAFQSEEKGNMMFGGAIMRDVKRYAKLALCLLEKEKNVLAGHARAIPFNSNYLLSDDDHNAFQFFRAAFMLDAEQRWGLSLA